MPRLCLIGTIGSIEHYTLNIDGVQGTKCCLSRLGLLMYSLPVGRKQLIQSLIFKMNEFCITRFQDILLALAVSFYLNVKIIRRVVLPWNDLIDRIGSFLPLFFIFVSLLDELLVIVHLIPRGLYDQPLLRNNNAGGIPTKTGYVRPQDFVVCRNRDISLYLLNVFARQLCWRFW